MSRLRSALLTATLLSLLAHWMLLDSLRAPPGEGAPVSKPTGAGSGAILAHIVSTAEDLDERVAPEGRSTSSTVAPPASKVRSKQARAHMQTKNLDPRDTPRVPNDMPMESPAEAARNPAEGLIAYRLALAGSGVALQAPDGEAVGLRLSIDAGGKPGEVRVLRSSGNDTRDAAVMRWATQAAAQVGVPGVLRGQEFVVELAVE